MIERIRNEPARVVAVVLATLGLLTSFGLGVTDAQSGSIVAFVGAFLALVGGEAVRGRVTPTHRLDRTRGEDGCISFPFGRTVKVDKRSIYVFEDDDYTDVAGTSIQFPHCDSLILHSPGTCAYCDRHPDWQALRSAQGVAFSNDSDEHIREHNLVPCPSTSRRPPDVRDRWGGNVPKTTA